MLKITEYAQRLIDDLDEVDYIERVKSQPEKLDRPLRPAPWSTSTPRRAMCCTVYTTRPDTLFGATYMVISPEHPMIEKWQTLITNMDEVRAYQARRPANPTLSAPSWPRTRPA
jgi:leucyl-tRNA synthetase